MVNIFYDKSSIVLRTMLSNPLKKWVVRDFCGSDGVSIGLSQKVLSTLEKIGCVERIKNGPGSYTVLSNPDILLKEWVKEYRFLRNTVHSFYSENRKIMRELSHLLERDNHAFTLHTGANLYTSFVNSIDIFVYLESEYLKKNLNSLVEELNLKKLIKGGNVHFVEPFYKKSVFLGSRKVKGYMSVSPLQLYLDLYDYPQRGREHAEYLKNILSEKKEFYV